MADMVPAELMKLMDVIFYIALLGLFIWSCVGAWRLQKQIRQPRRPEDLPPEHVNCRCDVVQRRTVDPKSREMWERLRFLEDDSCCRAMVYMRDNFDGAGTIRLTINNELVKTLPVNYCPRCGRKL